MSPPDQLPLPLRLPVRAARGRRDYYVSPSNAMAVSLIEGWEDWASRKFLLIGPEGAGKTHLAHVWSTLTGAGIQAAAKLARADIATLSDAPLCLEDVDTIAGDRAAEEAVFHLHNLLLANGHALLMTAETGPELWPLILPDLRSRLLGTQSTTLPEPDDALLGALLAKLFADRQIVPEAKVIPYLLRRMPRDYRAAPRIVDALDRAALGRSGGVTRPLAQSVLADIDRRTPPDPSPADES